MVIREFKRNICIYPFTEAQMETESSECFEWRVKVSPNLSVLKKGHPEDIGRIMCNFGSPTGSLTNAEFRAFAEKLGKAFDKAIEISDKLLSEIKL